MNPDFSLLLVALTAFTGLVWLIDSLLFRRRRMDRAVQTKVQRARDPVIIEYSRSLFPVLLIVLMFRSFLFEPFKIPSGSMIPTLLVGDFIVVNKYAYGLRMPVLHTKFLSLGEPERGDVVVFRYPVDPSVNFIKRLIGLPGDTISYRNKELYINGERVPEKLQGRFTSDEVKCSTPRSDALQFTETTGDVEHPILLHENSGGRNGQWQVPEGHYFVMGDNRDRSKDSRFIGSIPETHLVGEAVRIWMHMDGLEWPDWGRIGTKIQ